MPECPQHPHVSEAIKKLEHAVFGNGQPGLKTRTERVETKIDTAVRLLWALISLAIPSAIAIVTSAMTFLISS